MQRSPPFRIGGIDVLLNPLIFCGACPQPGGKAPCVAPLTIVVRSGLHFMFAPASIVVRIVKVLDRNTARLIAGLQVRPGFE